MDNQRPSPADYERARHALVADGVIGLTLADFRHRRVLDLLWPIAYSAGRADGEALPPGEESREARRERERQAAYLYSIIQSAEESEGGGPETDAERAYDAGILYAARMLLLNEAGDADWRAELYEYADEIRRRTEAGTPLPGRERKVVEAAMAWREAFDDPEADMNGPADVLARAVDALDQEGDDTNA